MNTKYLKKRTRALIECLRRAEEKRQEGLLTQRGEDSSNKKSLYSLAASVARNYAENGNARTLSADLTHRLETEYPSFSSNLFTRY